MNWSQQVILSYFHGNAGEQVVSFHTISVTKVVKTQLWMQFPITNKHTSVYHHREQFKTLQEELSPSSYSVPPGLLQLAERHRKGRTSLLSSPPPGFPLLLLRPSAAQVMTYRKNGTSLSSFPTKIQTHSLGAKDPHCNEQILCDCLISP